MQDNYQLTSTTDGLSGKRVLVVGPRQPIVDVLARLDIPFAIWSNQPMKRVPGCLKILTQSFPNDSTRVKAIAAHEFGELGPFTDVIAGTESSVFPASVCRRIVGARKSKDSIALRCSDKQQMKALMKKHSIPMTDYLFQSEALSPESVMEQLGPKVVVKQRCNSGGRGVSVASSVAELASRNERGLLYERYIEGNEMSIESFIRNGKIVFSSATNYLVKAFANIVPANVPQLVLKQAEEINRSVISALNLNWGLTHAEFYWSDNSVLFGEVALRPPGGYLMDCMSLAYEFDAWEAFVANELDVPYDFPGKPRKAAGVALFHAGEGTVIDTVGADTVKQMPNCVRLKVLVKPGTTVAKRSGVGEVSAYAMFISESQSTTVRDVEHCLKTLRFQIEQ